MKKIILLLLIGALLTACTTNQTTTGSSTAAASVPTAIVADTEASNGQNTPTDPPSAAEVLEDSSAPAPEETLRYVSDQEIKINGSPFEEILVSTGMKEAQTTTGETRYRVTNATLLLAGEWGPDCPPGIYALIPWAVFNTQQGLTQQEWLDEYTVPYVFDEQKDHASLRDSWVLRQEKFEPLVEEYFGIDAETLRKSDWYRPEQQGYIEIPACLVSPPFVYLRSASISEDNRVEMEVVLQAEQLQSDGSTLYTPYGDARVLTVERLPDGNFRYISCTQRPIAPEELIPAQ